MSEHHGLSPHHNNTDPAQNAASDEITRLHSLIEEELLPDTNSEETHGLMLLERTPQEERLVGYFEDFLATHSIEATMVTGPTKVAHLERFRFTPLVNTATKISLFLSEYIQPYDASVRYAGFGPYLDTRQAIGLVYDDMLVGVSGAGVDTEGRLFIVQLQDVSGLQKKDGRDFYKSGLHNGLLWRDTLVAAWEAIAQDIGIDTVIIQSHKNSRWEKVREEGHHAYDAIAQRMHYIPTDTNDWLKILKS
jgi:hypothetical protein